MQQSIANYVAELEATRTKTEQKNEELTAAKALALLAEKYGKVAGINVIDQGDDIILISEEGVVIRIQAKDVRICARPSKGVTLMRINEGNRVVSFAHLPHDDEESSSKPEDNGSEEEVTTENE